MLIAIDHGNKQVKTVHGNAIVSGVQKSKTRPYGRDILKYGGSYYTLSAQRIPYQNNHRRAGCVKGTEQIFTAAAHSALAVAALDIDGVAPVAACGAQELAEMRIGGSKTGNGQNITPISNCAQRNNSAQFL